MYFDSLSPNQDFIHSSLLNQILIFEKRKSKQINIAMEPLKVVVVGAGIGGLMAACALVEAGQDVHVSSGFSFLLQAVTHLIAGTV